MDTADLERLGLYDPTAPDAEDRLRLLNLLADRGAGEDDLVRAAATESLGALGLELTIHGPHGGMSFADAARAAGLDGESASAMWRAVGFGDPEGSQPRLSTAEVDALATLAGASRNLLGPAATHGVARVLGASAARLAEALVDAMRVEFEMPQRTSGVENSEVVSRYLEVAEAQLDSFLAVFDAVFRRHIVTVAAGNWSFDAEASASQRELVVGFVDMEGYTSLSRTLASRQLAELVEQFELIVSDAVSRHPARLIKLIGDAAMIVCDDALDACQLGLELVAQFGPRRGLPAIRVGLARGPVIAVRGDYFGEVVNLASRLAGSAEPSTVTVDDGVKRAAEAAFGFERLPATEPKGVERTPTSYRLVAAPSPTTPGPVG